MSVEHIFGRTFSKPCLNYVGTKFDSSLKSQV